MTTQPTNLILPIYKLQRGWIMPDRSLMPDSECEWLDEQEAIWRRNNPPLTDYQARKLFNLLPPPEAIRGQLDKEAIKDRADIVDIYRQLHPTLRVIERGRYITAQCFMHTDDRPSLSLNREKKLWYCPAGCCVGGDVITLIQKSEGLGFREALKRLSEML